MCDFVVMAGCVALTISLQAHTLIISGEPVDCAGFFVLVCVCTTPGLILSCKMIMPPASRRSCEGCLYVYKPLPSSQGTNGLGSTSTKTAKIYSDFSISYILSKPGSNCVGHNDVIAKCGNVVNDLLLLPPANVLPHCIGVSQKKQGICHRRQGKVAVVVLLRICHPELVHPIIFISKNSFL
jgi:hypothetical protein